jgi:hypothetical protein
MMVLMKVNVEASLMQAIFFSSLDDDGVEILIMEAARW